MFVDKYIDSFCMPGISWDIFTVFLTTDIKLSLNWFDNIIVRFILSYPIQVSQILIFLAILNLSQCFPLQFMHKVTLFYKLPFSDYSLSDGLFTNDATFIALLRGHILVRRTWADTTRSL